MSKTNLIAIICVASVLAAYVQIQRADRVDPKPPSRDQMLAEVRAHQERQREAFARDGRTATEQARAASMRGDHRAAIAVLSPFGAALDHEAAAVLRLAQASLPEQERREQAAASAQAEEIAQRKAAALAAAAAIKARIGPAPSPMLFGGYVEIDRYLRARAHDPDSIAYDSCTNPREAPDAWVVECSYRARNAFGALVRTQTVFLIRHGQVVETLQVR